MDAADASQDSDPHREAEKITLDRFHVSDRIRGGYKCTTGAVTRLVQEQVGTHAALTSLIGEPIGNHCIFSENMLWL